MRCAYCDEPIVGKAFRQDGFDYCSLLCAERATGDDPDHYDDLLMEMATDPDPESDNDND